MNRKVYTDIMPIAYVYDYANVFNSTLCDYKYKKGYVGKSIISHEQRKEQDYTYAYKYALDNDYSNWDAMSPQNDVPYSGFGKMRYFFNLTRKLNNG
jgi:hypothetical protein